MFQVLHFIHLSLLHIAIKSLKKINHPKLNIHQIGLSSSEGTTTINFDYDGSVWASIENDAYPRLNKKLNKTEKIEITTIDQFMNKNSIEKVDFMKIDIEGHEMEAFKGAKSSIENSKITIIQFEFGLASLHAGNKLKDYFSILENYDIYRILQDGIQKITYHETFEIYLTTNYLAVSKKLNLNF